MQLTELSPPGEPRILAGALRRTDHSIPEQPTGKRSLAELASDSEAVLVIDEAAGEGIQESLAALWEEVPPGESAFIVLVPRRPAPRVDPHYGDPTSSFFCTSDVFSRFLDLGIDCWARTLCFAVLRAIADGAIEVDRLLVVQTPLPEPRVYPAAPRKTVIVPHRGKEDYLRATLRYIRKSIGASSIVRVGLDVEDPTPYVSWANEFPDVEFYHFDPAPVGPYVIRQELAERSSEPFLALQDSDDLSCHNRFTGLGDALAKTGCGIVGSHELCLDEIRSLVQPVRFPLDPSAALQLCPNHALLHATLLTARSTFFDVGGLSTHLKIANDTQFLLRAYFGTTIRNVDEFLYVRRRHATSLTNAPETIYDNPLRRSLNSEWTGDFNAIKRGEMTLEKSSLRPMRRTEAWRVERLRVRSCTVVG